MSRKKLNVVFFFTDDQRYDTIRALGNNQIFTPNIDCLVTSGVSFTNAYIAGGSHEAVCMPSRAMLHTGRELFHLDRSGEQIPSDHALLGEAFQREGYRTYGTGKWHNGSSSYARSFTDGAEIFFGGMEDHWNVPACDFDPSGTYSAKPIANAPAYSNDLSFRQCDHIKAGKHSSELFADAAIDFLRDYESSDPFFMYVSFMAPHDPRTMPRKFLEMYDPSVLPLPGNFLPEHPFDNGALEVRDEFLAPHPRMPQNIRTHLAEYYAMISHLDEQIGRVMAELTRRGLAENTIVLLAGDNGLALGQHGLMGKQNLYEHSLKIPLVVNGPSIPANETRDAPVYLYDVFPTLCDLTGIAIPESVDGRSFATAIENAEVQTRDSLFFAYERYQRAVRQGRMKLIEYVVQGVRHTHLFDLEEDPFEKNNLAGIGSNARILAQLREQLQKRSASCGDMDSYLGKTFWSGYEDQ